MNELNVPTPPKSYMVAYVGKGVHEGWSEYDIKLDPIGLLQYAASFNYDDPRNNDPHYAQFSYPITSVYGWPNGKILIKD